MKISRRAPCQLGSPSSGGHLGDNIIAGKTTLHGSLKPALRAGFASPCRGGRPGVAPAGMDAETPIVPDPRAPKVSFVSLGCPKALVDSERIVTRLRAEGYELAREHAGADLVIVNTCGFLDSAQAESLAAIGAALERERQGDRDRLHGRRAREDHRGLSGRARGHRPAAIRERGRGGASGGAAAARPVPRSAAARGHQAHAAALRLSEDFRRLQQSLHASASSRGCAATWSRGRPPTCCARPSGWSPPA